MSISCLRSPSSISSLLFFVGSLRISKYRYDNDDNDYDDDADDLGFLHLFQYYLTNTKLWANSEDNKLLIFLFFSQEAGFDSSCELSPLEKICMTFQNLFSRKNKKYISTCCLQKILRRVLSICSYRDDEGVIIKGSVQ